VVSTVGSRNALSEIVFWIYTRHWRSTKMLSNCVAMDSVKDIRRCGRDSGVPWRWATPCSQACCR